MEAAVAGVAAIEAEAKEEIFHGFAVGAGGVDGVAVGTFGRAAHGCRSPVYLMCREMQRRYLWRLSRCRKPPEEKKRTAKIVRL